MQNAPSLGIYSFYPFTVYDRELGASGRILIFPDHKKSVFAVHSLLMVVIRKSTQVASGVFALSQVGIEMNVHKCCRSDFIIGQTFRHRLESNDITELLDIRSAAHFFQRKKSVRRVDWVLDNEPS